MSRASANDVLTLLRERSDEILSRLQLPNAQLSMPVDGRGVRIQVSVPPEDVRQIPDELRMDVGGKTVEVKLEATPDYQPFRAY